MSTLSRLLPWCLADDSKTMLALIDDVLQSLSVVHLYDLLVLTDDVIVWPKLTIFGRLY
jgi:hypothetical protein